MSLIDILNKESKLWIIAPHADDEILGCGGLIARAKEVDSEIYLLLATLSGFKAINGGTDSQHGERENELRDVIRSVKPAGYDVLFRKGEYHLELDTLPIKDIINWLEIESNYSFTKVRPNIVLLPSGNHNHQDHRAIHEAGLTIIRTNPKINSHDLLILEYEVPGTGQPGFSTFSPNLYIELSIEQLEKKCNWFSLYTSQVADKPHLRSLHAIKTLASFRGLETGYDFAEAFNIIMSKIPNRKRKYEKIVEQLYLQENIGLSDVAKRLESNTQLGDFDLAKRIASNLELRAGDIVLDVGCGTGKHLSQFRKKYGILPYGMDVTEKEIEDLNINFERGSAKCLPYDNNTFDKVMCNYALYYIEDWQKAVNEMLRVAKPEGIVLITGPALENNLQFYSFHKEIFGELSEIDEIALRFIQGKLEPYLTEKGVRFEAKTYDNNILYPTKEDFLRYYTSTSLFRMTCEKYPEDFIINKVNNQIENIFSSQTSFENTKKIRFVKIENA